MSEDSVFGAVIEPAHDVIEPPVALGAAIESVHKAAEALPQEHHEIKDALGNLITRLEPMADGKQAEQQQLDAANAEIEAAKAAINSAMASGGKHNAELRAALQSLEQMGTVTNPADAAAAIQKAQGEVKTAKDIESVEIHKELAGAVVALGGMFEKIASQVSRGEFGAFPAMAVNEASTLFAAADHGLGGLISAVKQQQNMLSKLQLA